MPLRDNPRHWRASNRELSWVGTAWGGGPIDAAERISPANSTAEEIVGLPGKEEGYSESRGLNLPEFVRDSGFL